MKDDSMFEPEDLGKLLLNNFLKENEKMSYIFHSVYETIGECKYRQFLDQKKLHLCKLHYFGLLYRNELPKVFTQK